MRHLFPSWRTRADEYWATDSRMTNRQFGNFNFSACQGVSRLATHFGYYKKTPMGITPLASQETAKEKEVDTRTLEQKIQWLTDIEAIRNLMARYCHGIDKQDETSFMSIWADDATYELPRGIKSGLQGINELVHKVWREVPKCHHHITNPLISVDQDEASALTDVIYYRQTDDGTLQLLSGTYAMTFRRVAGAWKIHHLKFSSFGTLSPVFAQNNRL